MLAVVSYVTESLAYDNIRGLLLVSSIIMESGGHIEEGREETIRVYNHSLKCILKLIVQFIK